METNPLWTGSGETWLSEVDLLRSSSISSHLLRSIGMKSGGKRPGSTTGVETLRSFDMNSLCAIENRSSFVLSRKQKT